VNSALNSPLYTTFPLFTPLLPIIFPIPPHLSPVIVGLILDVKKPRPYGQGLRGKGLLTGSYDDPNAPQGER
jgi:hypothetical protein